MSAADIAALAAAARKLANKHDLEVTDDPAMCFDDDRLVTIEQVCHELSHALQLGMDPDVKVSDDVGAALGAHPEKDLHEVRCFAISEEVFWLLGIGKEWDQGDAIAAAEVQVDTRRWNRRTIQSEWTRFAPEAQPMAERIARMFKEVDAEPIPAAA